MTLNAIQHRRVTLERLLFDTNHELVEIQRNCYHKNIGKGRLTFSPAQKKVVQTYKIDQGNNATVYCQDCDLEFGWFCPKSLKGYCEYYYSTHGEQCIWCGVEKERK